MTYILKLKEHNRDKEIAFELKFLLSLSRRQRFEMMFNKTKEILALSGKSGYRKTTEVIKRA